MTNLRALPALCMFLTGCDMASYFPDGPQPVPVISPGYQVSIDGHTVTISGFDNCPQKNVDGNLSADTDRKSCIALEKARTEVKVIVAWPDNVVIETWRINREKDTHDNEAIRLQRPNGEFVKSFN